MNSNVRVLVVDDSAFFRRRVTEMLRQAPGIEVIGTASDGLEAVRQVRKLRPDVITMDVEMPIMDGITAVKRIMAVTSTPILMFSSLTHEGASATLEALEAGALDFLPKQYEQEMGGKEALKRELVRKVLAIGRREPVAGIQERPPRFQTPPPLIPSRTGRNRLVAIGASTGGPMALQQILTSLPADFSLPILLVVHMPANFTAAFAQRLNGLCRIEIREAADGDRLKPGLALLAPGGRQMLMEGGGRDGIVRITDAQNGQIYRPSVDVTFESAARIYPDGVLGVILTGMGADGLQGARLLREGGSEIWSQDEASCVVYGMPQAVEKAGVSSKVVPLAKIGALLSEVIGDGPP